MTDVYSLVPPTGPAPLPISVAEAGDFLKVEDEDDSVTLATLIRSVVQFAEFRTSRDMRPQTWKLTEDAFPADTRFCLRRSPVASVTSITYLRWDGVSDHDTITVPATDYYLKPGQDWSEILLLSSSPAGSPASGAWPTDVTVQQPEANVFVEFKTKEPEFIEAAKASMLKHLAALWANRGDCLSAAGAASPVIVADLGVQCGAAAELDFYSISRI